MIALRPTFLAAVLCVAGANASAAEPGAPAAPAAAVAPVGPGASAAPVVRPAPPKPRLVAFIGEQLSYEQLPCNPRTAEKLGDVDEFGCGSDDYVYIGRYRVIETLTGDVSGVVEFESAGFILDDVASSRWAVLYVGIAPTRTWLVGELSRAVYPTIQGGWAACDSESAFDDDLTGPIQLLNDPSFGDVRWMSPRGKTALFPPPTYAIVDGRARCRRGLELPELIETLETKLARYGENGGWIDDENAPPDP